MGRKESNQTNKTSGLSILMHGVISLPDPTSYDNLNFTVLVLLEVLRGTYICAHPWIFFKRCILITHYIQTMKMHLAN